MECPWEINRKVEKVSYLVVCHSHEVLLSALLPSTRSMFLWNLRLKCAIFLIGLQSSTAYYLTLAGNLKHKDLFGQVVSSQVYADGDDVDEEARNNMAADVDEQVANSDQVDGEEEWSAWFNSRSTIQSKSWMEKKTTSFNKFPSRKHTSTIVCVEFVCAPMNVFTSQNCI